MSMTMYKAEFVHVSALSQCRSIVVSKEKKKLQAPVVVVTECFSAMSVTFFLIT
jgi:hypothetical protein